MSIIPQLQETVLHSDFDVRELLGRHWLKRAMKQWIQETPVRIRLSRQQAERLQRDWYYQHAIFEPLSEHLVLMTFGEEDQKTVLELLRWLGPGAELIEPVAWRAAMQIELVQMLAEYANTASE